MENLLRKTRSTLSLRPRDLHRSKSTPNLPPYPKHPPPTPISLTIEKLERVQDEMTREIDLMPDGVKTNSLTPLDCFMAAVDRRNATYLLFRQLPYAI